MKRNLLLFFSFAILGSCETEDKSLSNPIISESGLVLESHPENVEDLKEFNQKDLGSYRQINDYSRTSLIILSDAIVIMDTTEHKIGRQQVFLQPGAEFTVDNDSALVSEFQKEGFVTTLKNDSLHLIEYRSDTIFSLDESSILKPHEKGYYINLKDSTNDWLTALILLDNDSLFTFNLLPIQTNHFPSNFSARDLTPIEINFIKLFDYQCKNKSAKYFKTGTNSR